MVALNSDLSDVQKRRTDQEEAKRTAEETIERERKEHDEKVSKTLLFAVCCDVAVALRLFTFWGFFFAIVVSNTFCVNGCLKHTAFSVE